MAHRGLCIGQRLYLLTAIALAPGLGMLLYNEFFMRASRMEQVHQSALRAGEQASLEIQRLVSGAEATLKVLARAPSVRGFDTDNCVPFLADVVATIPEYFTLAAIDANGDLRCRGVMPDIPVNVRDRPYFHRTMEERSFHIGTYQISVVTGQATLPMAFPITDEADEVIGVVVAGLDLDWMNEMLSKRNFGGNDALTLADREGIIIARYPFPEEFVGTRIPEQFMPLVTATSPGTQEVVSQDGTRRIIGYYPVSHSPQGLYISAGIGFEDALHAHRQATIRGIAFIAIGALIAFALATLTGRTLVRRPIEHVLATIADWRRGNRDARTGMNKGANEFGNVGAAIDEFLDDLERSEQERTASERQRALLAGELQHRVKNTMATISAVAGQTFRGNEHAAKLHVFQNRLSAMGSAYEIFREENWNRSDLRSLLSRTLSAFPAEKISLVGPDLPLAPKPALAIAMAVHELATNAAKYGALSVSGGKVDISWSEDDGLLAFTWIERDGPVVSPPKRHGFGSKLITQILAVELGCAVTVEFHAEGLVCRFEVAVSILSDGRNQAD